MKTIQLTDEQYQALMQGESVTIEPPKKVKWEPKGGDWWVSANGCVERDIPSRPTRCFGTEYQTKKAAEKARDAMRTHNRLLAWLAENDDGWIADWSDTSNIKYCVFYKHQTNKWDILSNNAHRTPGIVYMSHKNAKKLCKLLNDGIVEL